MHRTARKLGCSRCDFCVPRTAPHVANPSPNPTPAPPHACTREMGGLDGLMCVWNTRDGHANGTLSSICCVTSRSSDSMCSAQLVLYGTTVLDMRLILVRTHCWAGVQRHMFYPDPHSPEGLPKPKERL
mmetsp:Transcript_74494/g.125525  ORF Transcript_74494/g.125525 Transcript_74494/m.125525 type:complete len:129 (+) Transcript_74494:3088-3474(+)